jgi:hypothetical protein
MDDLLASIRAKKAALDEQRPMAEAALRLLQKYYGVELTYTSNAIEGNTPTLRETAEVLIRGGYAPCRGAAGGSQDLSRCALTRIAQRRSASVSKLHA